MQTIEWAVHRPKSGQNSVGLVALRARKIIAWYRTNENLLREAAAYGLMGGLLAWFSFYVFFELGEWFDRGTLGREPGGLGGTYVACALAVGYSGWWVLGEQASKAKAAPRRRGDH
jgi:hypothetical protein